MKRTKNQWVAWLAMMLLVFAIGCSDDDDGGTGPGDTVDDFAVISEAGDDYFGVYSGINPSASAVYAPQ